MDNYQESLNDARSTKHSSVKLSNVVERRICGPLELGLLLVYYREGLRCDLWRLVLRLGLELGLLLLCYREGLRCDL